MYYLLLVLLISSICLEITDRKCIYLHIYLIHSRNGRFLVTAENLMTFRRNRWKRNGKARKNIEGSCDRLDNRTHLAEIITLSRIADSCSKCQYKSRSHKLEPRFRLGLGNNGRQHLLRATEIYIHLDKHF